MFKLHKFMKGETTVQAVLIIKLVIKLFFFVSFFHLGLKHPHILSAREQGGAQQSTDLCVCFQDPQEIVSPTLSMVCAVVSRELILKQSAYTAVGCAVNPD